MNIVEMVSEVVNTISEDKKYYKNYLSPTSICNGNNLVEMLEYYPEEICNSVVQKIRGILPTEHPYQAIWWYSILCYVKKDAGLLTEFIGYVFEKKDFFSDNTLYFLYYQLKAYAFSYYEVDVRETKEALWKLYLEVVRNFENKLTTSLEYIPYDKRKQNNCIVITEQILEDWHGPTKTALDRCKILMEECGKNVLLINTTEIASEVGSIPFKGEVQGQIIRELENMPELEWKGCRIPYVQCTGPMPDINVIDELLRQIRLLAPERIISIGGSSLLTSLANKMIPTLVIGLCPSDLECTTADFQTLTRPIMDSDYQMISNLGFDDCHIVPSIFTSSLKPQTEQISRREIGIEEDKFVMAVVGARLDEEVTSDLLSTIENLINENMLLVFLGNFSDYESKVADYPKLQKYSKYLGFCDDILSRIELCDLYINPIRKGGGTSCVEALYKGVPVVTLRHGDVWINTGDEFAVENYEEMQMKILEYYEDQEYYNQMSLKAVERTELLLDTSHELKRLLSEVRNREIRMYE